MYSSFDRGARPRADGAGGSPASAEHEREPSAREEDLRAFLMELNRKVRDQEREARVKAAAQDLKANPERFMDAIAFDAESPLRESPVFQHMDADELFAVIVDLPNALRTRLELAIRTRYKSRVPETFKVELPVLERLRMLLEEHCQKERQRAIVPLSRRLLCELSKTLGVVVGRLEQTGKSGAGEHEEQVPGDVSKD